jgi:DNA-binding GntR family transcriptional regulator
MVTMQAEGYPDKVRPRPGDGTATGRVRGALEEEILSGDLKPGERLDETGLSLRFGVSRTPVREALKQLAASGLVRVRPHQGATVVKPTLAELLEMFEVMGSLEATCARLAARRHTLADQAAMRAALEACEAAAARGDGFDYYGANNHFHEAIYTATRNNFLAGQTLGLRNRLMPYRRFITFHPGRMSRSNRQHREVMEAIFAMDVETAAARMAKHLETLSEDVAVMITSTVEE